MLNIVKYIRGFVFLFFIICNSIVASVAVWNLSIVQASVTSNVPKQVTIYSIFVGSSGLLMIFPVLFADIYRAHIFLCTAWFELAWIALYALLELGAAVAVTSQMVSLLCGDNSVTGHSACRPTLVLQVFTWIIAVLLLAYLTLLAILSVAKSRDDPTIWFSTVREYPWTGGMTSLRSRPNSPNVAPAFRDEGLVVAAPIPQRIHNLRAALVLDSGPQYDIERSGTPISIFLPDPNFEVSPQGTQPISSSPFYHSVVRTAINDSSPATLLPAEHRPSSSPPPLGSWPRLDAMTHSVEHKPAPFQNPQHHWRSPQRESTETTSSARRAPHLRLGVQPRAISSRPSGPRQRSTSVDFRPLGTSAVPKLRVIVNV